MNRKKKNCLFAIEILAAAFLIISVNIVAGKVNYGLEGDEVFSYISSTSMGGFKGICYLNDQQWYDADYFRSAVTATGNERFNVKMVVENQVMDTHPPLFYLFLNLICSVFDGRFSKWFGIGLNIFFMLFAALGFYLLLQYFIKDRQMSLILSTVFCCSSLSVGMVLFIRMYVLLMALALFQTWYHLIIYDKMMSADKASPKETVKRYAVLILLTLAGGLTHYYFLVFQALISGMLVMALIVHRKYKSILHYGAAMIGSAVIYICLYPASINHIFFKYNGRDAVHKFLKESSLIGDAVSMMSGLNEKLFKGCLPYIVCTLLLATVAVIAAAHVRPMTVLKDPLLLTAPALIYIYGISKASPYITVRYIAPAAPLLYAAIIVWGKRLIDSLPAIPVPHLTRAAKALLCLCLFFTTFYFFEKPVKDDYFANRQAVVDALSEEADYCVFVGDGVNYWRMWEDYVNYPAFQGLFFINGKEQLPISDQKLLSQENVVIYIDQTLNSEDILNYLRQYLPFRAYDVQYETNYTKIIMAGMG